MILTNGLGICTQYVSQILKITPYQDTIINIEKIKDITVIIEELKKIELFKGESSDNRYAIQLEGIVDITGYECEFSIVEKAVEDEPMVKRLLPLNAETNTFELYINSNDTNIPKGSYHFYLRIYNESIYFSKIHKGTITIKT